MVAVVTTSLNRTSAPLHSNALIKLTDLAVPSLPENSLIDCNSCH